MNNPICQIHNVEMVWKTGLSGPQSKKPGTPYAFWGCPDKMPDGNFCKYQPVAGSAPAPASHVPVSPNSTHQHMNPSPTAPSSELIIKVDKILEIVEWLQNNIVDDKFGTGEGGIPFKK